jgi:hypothetical protein
MTLTSTGVKTIASRWRSASSTRRSAVRCRLRSGYKDRHPIRLGHLVSAGAHRTRDRITGGLGEQRWSRGSRRPRTASGSSSRLRTKFHGVSSCRSRSDVVGKIIADTATPSRPTVQKLPDAVRRRARRRGTSQQQPAPRRATSWRGTTDPHDWYYGALTVRFARRG